MAVQTLFWSVYFCCGKYLPGRLSGFGVWSIFTGIIEHGVLVNIYFGQYLSGGKGMAFQTLLGWYIFVVVNIYEVIIHVSGFGQYLLGLFEELVNI